MTSDRSLAERSGVSTAASCATAPVCAQVRIGGRKLRISQPEIDALRERTGQLDDAMTSPQRLISWAAMHDEQPAAVLLYRTGVLWGVALLTFRRLRGIPLGLATGGNLAGQGSVIAQDGEQVAVLEAATRFLLRRFLIPVVKFSLLLPYPVASLPAPVSRATVGHWSLREVRLRLRLEGGMPAVMERLSYKMRRNVRYYRRRAETQLGWIFVPAMTPAQRQHAVAALHGEAPYPTPARKAWLRESLMQDMPGGFAMGLHDPAGKWVSYLTGWRTSGGTYVDWQLNSESHESASVSTVMRAYLLEHEAARGSPSIVFVGLTAPFWGRACETAVCADLIATGNGPVGWLVRALATWISPSGQVAALLGRTSAAEKSVAMPAASDREVEVLSAQ